ncbi:response regulator transcription factor [Clostridium saccharobutylicum]|uniref:Stage 0 sporulation protein A homolog n=1 Tax=Clostridium saccharobutylicum DSM 13864 TaxID=1345695 RepID=U5MTT3_CLOSA|nr:response regulator transcription factor [Clostridium saccharobutylicum]AGX44204.1 transcriptional regulatory protein SrrA [Clostridium saccharobutylicum DSM 13864]AQR91491.1 transcriptional regulatory protein SrrA [Clostridium saccharobutylicum]AQS01396.1 transcriptional regulatory protein SrrA [Clostridium saccharobutylicum]AQS11005.1 transcriptional regulatory protein SrrA [Clostridium saccharobutylicum]AQS15379.1 transcriptional regulatory protein SrrA [Clostridium saccharobutylicum]
MEIKILIAEDDAIFRELVCDIIRKEGYIPIEACDGKEAIDVFFNLKDIDIIILDVMMPVYDGWEVLKEIREHSDIPVIMLTALGDEKHEVIGLNKGADDYISKPFSYEVFIARINNMVRKLKKEHFKELIMGKIKINQETHKVSVDDFEVELNNKEYSLLTYFLKNCNRVLTREQILCNIWGYDFNGDIRTIDTHIKTLRAKLLNCGNYIKTVRGSGYMFEVSSI